MAITITRYPFNNGFYDYHNGQEEAPIHVGSVLSNGTYYRHVHSDNVMIDSGLVQWADVWMGDRVERLEWDLGRNDSMSLRIEVDADAETKAKAESYAKAMAVAVTVLQAFRDRDNNVWESKKVKVGCKVEVFKGRKVPKGTYFVRNVSGGNYGPYVDLSTTQRPEVGNKNYTYVSPDNVRVIGETVAMPYGETARQLAELVLGKPYSYPKVEKDLTAFIPLADALEEEGKDELAQGIRAYLATVKMMEMV